MKVVVKIRYVTAAHLQDDRDVYCNAGWADATKILRALFVECLQSEDSLSRSGQTTMPKDTHDPAKTLGVTNLGKVNGDRGTPGVDGNRKTGSKMPDHFCKRASTCDSLSE